MSVPAACRDSSSLLLRTIPALQCGRAWIVPEGRTRVAQRFNAGIPVVSRPRVPEGRLIRFSRG